MITIQKQKNGCKLVRISDGDHVVVLRANQAVELGHILHNQELINIKPKVDAEAIITDYNTRKDNSLRQIASRHNVSYVTVKNVLDKAK